MRGTSIKRNSLSAIDVYEVKDEKTKRQAIFECDNAYSISVVGMENFEEFYEKISKRAEFLCAFDNVDNTIAGYAALYANDVNNKCAYISLICIKEEYQGIGAGYKLLKECFNVARNKGMEKIRLEVLSMDNKAISFYKRNGFIIEDKNNVRDSYYMTRNLLVSE